MANARNKKALGEGTRRRLQDIATVRFKATERQRKWRAVERERVQALHAVGQVTPNRESQALQRMASKHTRKLGFEFALSTVGKGLQYQTMVLKNFLQQPVLQPALPEVVANEKKFLQCAQVCENLKETWNTLKYARGTDHHRARNAVEAAIVNDCSQISARGISRCLGINAKSVRRGFQRRHLINAAPGVIWANCNRRRRFDSLSPEVASLIVQWWIDQTRVSPNRKDVVVKRTGRKQSETHARHLLEESQLDFYTRFVSVHPTMNVGLRAFENLKPYFVYKLKDFNSCCSKCHQEMIEIKAAFNTIQSVAVHLEGKDCTCLCACSDVCARPLLKETIASMVSCQASSHTHESITSLWESILCPREFGNSWHRLECIKSECAQCGPKLLKLCPTELDSNNPNLMSWRCFEKVQAGFTKEGEPKQVIRLQTKQSIPRIFLDYALPKLKEFVLHNFIAQWQEKEYKRSVSMLRNNECLSLIDFAENYSFRGQNEIQVEHWYNFQVTILVHITYRLNPSFDPLCPSSKEVLTEYFYYISDDKKHDNVFVQHCLQLHWKHLLQNEVHISRHIVWSDGCAAQFKGARSWFHIARYPSLTKCSEIPIGCQMEWHYWGTGHGKGPHDGAGAVLKRALRKEQLKPSIGVTLNNAEDVVVFLNTAMNLDHVAYWQARPDVKWNFWLIKTSNIDKNRGMNCKTIPGSRRQHSVRSVSSSNNTLLQIRELSCFCSHCIDGSLEPCPRDSYVSPWNLITLQPCNANDSLCDHTDESTEVGGNGDELAIDLQVGDNFAVRASIGNVENVSFYLLQCVRTLHTATSDQSPDDWGFSIESGDDIVIGRYYKQSGRSPRSYTLVIEKGPAFIYSHLVRVTKFSMPLAKHKQKGGTSVYSLSCTTLEQIRSILAEDEETDEDQSQDEDSMVEEFDED